MACSGEIFWAAAVRVGSRLTLSAASNARTAVTRILPNVKRLTFRLPLNTERHSRPVRWLSLDFGARFRN